MMKKILSMVLFLFLCFALVACGEETRSGSQEKESSEKKEKGTVERFKDDNGLFEYTIQSENTVSLYYYYGTEANASIVIPEKVTFDGKTYSVVEIEEYSFINKSISTVLIPKSITKIGECCFDTIEKDPSLTIYYVGSLEDWNQIDLDLESQYWSSYAQIVYNYRP